MQTIHTRWSGKAFALSRCHDSQDKKLRSRRTKEERKTMVESFIKTYRDLNNGKFPSLNLTHKEVGGSFYTVREIVREIIQENRVLGPGNINSKLLDPENCLEEHADESISTDSDGHLSIATFCQPTHKRQEAICSSSNEHRVTSEEMIERDKSGIQETFASHLNGLSMSQLMQGYKKTNFGELSEKPDDNSVGVDELYAEVQVKGNDPEIYEVERQVLHRYVPITSSLRESTMNGDETGNRSTMAKETNSSASGSSASKVAGTDSLPETNITMNSITGSVSDEVLHYSCDEEDSSFAAIATKICNTENSQNVEGSRIYLEVSKTSAKVGVTNMPFGSGSYINGTGPTELHSSSVVDENSAESMSKPLSQDFSTLATTTYVEEPMILPEDSEIVINNTKNASAETLHLSAKKASHAEVEAKGTNHVELEAGNAHKISNTVIEGKPSRYYVGKICGQQSTFVKRTLATQVRPGSVPGKIRCSILSENTNKEAEGTNVNSVWAVIKSVLSAVINFWTE